MAKVLIPLDGSFLAISAVPLGATLALARGDGLMLLQAAPTTLMTPEAALAANQLEDGALTYLREVARGIQERYGVEPELVAEFGAPVEVILRRARKPDISYVVMSTHGRSGLLRTVLGSVAEDVLRAAPVPVFLVPAAATLPDNARFGRIVVPLDGSDLSYAIIAPVTELAQRFDFEIVLLHVGPEVRALIDENGHVLVTIDQQVERLKLDTDRYLSPIRARLEARGLRARIAFRIGDPATCIIELAETERADAIALATHGRSGIERLRYGSVAEAVLRHSPVPVLTFGREAIKRLRSGVSMLAV